MQVWNVLRTARWKCRTQKSSKSRHLGTIAQLCRAISSQLRHVLTIRKKNLLSSNISPTCPHNMVNFGPQVAEIRWQFRGTHENFNGFRVLALLLHGIQVVGVSQRYLLLCIAGVLCTSLLLACGWMQSVTEIWLTSKFYLLMENGVTSEWGFRLKVQFLTEFEVVTRLWKNLKYIVAFLQENRSVVFNHMRIWIVRTSVHLMLLHLHQCGAPLLQWCSDPDWQLEPVLFDTIQFIIDGIRHYLGTDTNEISAWIHIVLSVRWCPYGDFWRLFCVLYLQRATCSTFQTCILNSH